MKTIKINNNSVPDDFKDTKLVRVKDIISLIDEDIELASFLVNLKDKVTGEVVEIPDDIQIILNAYWDYLKEELKTKVNNGKYK